MVGDSDRSVCGDSAYNEGVNGENTHIGKEALLETRKQYAVGINVSLIVKNILQKCEICLRNNPKIQKRPPPGKAKGGMMPGDYWQIDFFT